MTIKEFEENYYLHDSIISGVKVDKNEKRIVLLVDFAFWMQKDYRDNDPETGIISISFDNVDNYSIPSGVNWDEVSILETTVTNNSITFSMINDLTDDYIELMIESQEVKVEIV